jgi:hypothetical protein
MRAQRRGFTRVCSRVPIVLAAFALALCAPSAAHAQGIDPCNLQIYNTGTGGGDPNNIGSTGLVTINQVGSGTDTNPVILVIAIPNDPSAGGDTFFGNTTSKGFVNPITSVTTGSGVLGGTVPTGFVNSTPTGSGWNVDTGFAGTMTATTSTNQGGTVVTTGKGNSKTPGDVFATIGFAGQGIDKSNSFTNMAASDNTNTGKNTTNPGVTATSFSLYAFEITVTGGLAAGSTVAIQFGSGILPNGSYAMAYSQSSDGKEVYVNAFTEAGQENGSGGGGPGNGVVSEPPSLALLGLGAIGLVGFSAWTRRRRLAVA